MTEQERIEGFGQEFNALMQKFGVTINIRQIPEVHGDIVQVRVETLFAVLPNWMPPPTSPPDPHNNGNDHPGDEPAFVKSLVNGTKGN